jgi:hypothetical protein
MPSSLKGNPQRVKELYPNHGVMRATLIAEREEALRLLNQHRQSLPPDLHKVLEWLVRRQQ